MMIRYRVILFFLFLTLTGTSTFAANSTSSPDWQESFDTVCAGTLHAMSLSINDLNILIDRCNTLNLELAHLDSTRAKFYRKRLNLACNFYRVILEKKQVELQLENQLELQSERRSN